MDKVTPAAAVNEMEQLRKRFDELSKRKTVCETQLETAEDTLKALKAQALAEYGTEDLDTLRERLEEMKAENQRRQEAYKASLDAIEANLKEVDRASSQTGA